MKKNKPLLERVTKALTADQDRIRERQLNRTAYHEAGHAVAQVVLGDLGMTVAVTLNDDEELVIGGSCYCRGMSGTQPERLRKHMIVLAAGAAAMKRYDPTSHGGGSEDDKTLKENARELFGCLEGKRRREREIQRARRRAANLVRIYWPEIEATAKRLIDNHLFLATIRRRTVADF